MVCDAVAVLLQASVAIHVLVLLYVLAQVPAVVTSVNVSDGVLHKSLAVGIEKTGGFGQLIVKGSPTPLITGGVRSSVQVTVLDMVAVLPQPSVAVNVLVYDLLHVTAMTSSILPLCVIVVEPQLSVAVALPYAAIIVE